MQGRQGHWVNGDVPPVDAPQGEELEFTTKEWPGTALAIPIVIPAGMLGLCVGEPVELTTKSVLTAVNGHDIPVIEYAKAQQVTTTSTSVDTEGRTSRELPIKHDPADDDCVVIQVSKQANRCHKDAHVEQKTDITIT